ncbi:MAG: cytochrome c oxidase subunit II [Pseudomonadota bacterium]|nr:cytochrome c oxidase subunit II [Pseudomonadota bacterium]
MTVKKFAAFAALTGFLAALAVPALADQPRPWQIWHQTAASDMMARIEWFDFYTLWFIVPITILVMVLLLIVMVRFNRRANPVASRTSHNSLVEIIWTVVPIVILVAIAYPSFDLLERQLAPEEEPAMTVKATGYQWYWGYEYQDEGGLSFDSIMLREDERADYGKADKAAYPRLLAVNNEMVVPVDTMVRVLVAGADVLHSFTVPAFGFKVDAVPGRINETWFKAEREGLYYGQCSELCGRDHAFMPIAVRVVSQAQYDAWKTQAENDLEGANAALMAEIERERAMRVAGN